MKWLIASDIHGSAYYCEKLVSAFEKEKADKLLLLGDYLYHGPRNDLPRDYNPKKVIEMLNKLSDKIVAVRGNCDSEVDQMVLDFPMMADYVIVCDSGKTIFATHGHIFGKDNPPKIKGDVLLCGHTHVSACIDCQDFTYINPGSVSIPKENTPHGYLVFENGAFSHKEL
jgi:putative phosphoesterase